MLPASLPLPLAAASLRIRSESRTSVVPFGSVAPAAAPFGPSPATSGPTGRSARSPRSSTPSAECAVSSASTVAVRSPDSGTVVRTAGAASRTPGTAAKTPDWPNSPSPPESTRTDVPARKSAWSSCERFQDAP